MKTCYVWPAVCSYNYPPPKYWRLQRLEVEVNAVYYLHVGTCLLVLMASIVNEGDRTAVVFCLTFHI